MIFSTVIQNNQTKINEIIIFFKKNNNIEQLSPFISGISKARQRERERGIENERATDLLGEERAK